MARGLFRKTSFMKTVGAYRSLWKRTLLRFFFPGYGMKGMGWLRDPKKAWYNWLYHRTSLSIPRLLGYKPSWGGTVAAMLVASVFNIFSFPVDAVKASSKSSRIKKAAKERGGNFGKIKDFECSESCQKKEKRQSPVSQRKEGVKNTKEVNYNKSTNTPKPSVNARVFVPVIKEENNEPDNKTHTSMQEYVSGLASSLDRVHTTVKSAENTKTESERVSDEITPKSVPQDTCDQYISKRMWMQNVENDSENVISEIKTGTYLDIRKCPAASRIMLVLGDKPVGYIPDSDFVPVNASLCIGRHMYAVVTDIRNGQCEIEIWFRQ